ncbi:hypothetical protein HanRHA438_Chr10g0445601 [Helianthus annuus]|nr:hypothetical protein HanIR_Chr10g0467161 [Helianthus annuus]KAJ0878935.1 hypothetical protein HanRHA438_Chr10g0445601 [Helianthus annuus]
MNKSNVNLLLISKIPKYSNSSFFTIRGIVASEFACWLLHFLFTFQATMCFSTSRLLIEGCSSSFILSSKEKKKALMKNNSQ